MRFSTPAAHFRPLALLVACALLRPIPLTSQQTFAVFAGASRTEPVTNAGQRFEQAHRAMTAAPVLLAPAAAKITIAAAADLKFAMDEIAETFRRSHPGDRVDVVYGSSGKFHAQIRQGAPFDIFFSADVGFARELRTAGEAVSEPKLYAIGRIVLWSATRDASRMTVADLADSGIRRIAIANPQHAPYGKRAEEALRRAGVWDLLEPKLVYGENIAQTAQFVLSGAADIGIIALSLAVNPELARKGGYALIPAGMHAALEQAYVITKHGADNHLAFTFAAYMETPGARRILARYGFVLPGEPMAE